MDSQQESVQYRSFGEQTLHYFTRAHERIPDRPIAGPAIWSAPEMRRSEAEWSETLSGAELDELERVLDQLETARRSLDSINRADAALSRWTPRIVRWRETLAHGRGFVVLRGLPTNTWGEARSALAFWILGHHLGVPGAQNSAGELLGHVSDYRENVAAPNVRLYRTADEIGYHCDAADVVGLLRLQTAARGGLSRIASSGAIFNTLLEEDPKQAALLFEPFALDRRDEQPPGQPGAVDLPPCRFDARGSLRSFYHSAYFRSADRLDSVPPLSVARRALLDRYDALAADPEYQLEMELGAGDVQLISNHTIVHARSGYVDQADPARRRHLLRLWLSLDPGASLREGIGSGADQVGSSVIRRSPDSTCSPAAR